MRSQTPRIPPKPRRNLVPRLRNRRNYRRLLYRLSQGQQVS
ncbi:MAG: 30S ribosomal protein S30e [Vulcanisaeta sp.]|nr:30S ribosomal protein S30e [Vulcanisaeta sp.]